LNLVKLLVALKGDILKRGVQPLDFVSQVT